MCYFLRNFPVFPNILRCIILGHFISCTPPKKTKILQFPATYVSQKTLSYTIALSHFPGSACLMMPSILYCRLAGHDPAQDVHIKLRPAVIGVQAVLLLLHIR